jgi:3-deoxy-D-manno-octulosonic-acid transferase
VILYNSAIRILRAGIGVASLWKPKAKAWITGRTNNFKRLEDEIHRADRTIWMHCASAGELEQGKSLAEALKASFPSHKLVVSFFSPSGFEAGMKYKTADITCYLPLDTRENARRFFALVHPDLVIFIKYEYWYNHLHEAAQRKIPVLLVSAIFRPGQSFFKPWGGFFRKILELFTWIFVQDEDSQKLLQHTGMNNCSVTGDTRFDRVLKIKSAAEPVNYIEEFTGSKKVLVAGSTWREDEDLLFSLLDETSLKMVIAPHEISASNISRIMNRLNEKAILYSDASKYTGSFSDVRVLVIDNFGMLSGIYQYADVSYVGGGFNKSGIHNTLEAAAWGKPVIFGPNYKKFREAKGLIEEGAGYSISNATELNTVVKSFLNDAEKMKAAGERAKQYVEKNAGATMAIMDHIQRNRLLTTS